MSYVVSYLVVGQVISKLVGNKVGTSSSISTAGAAMLPIRAMVETKPIPVCL